MNAHEIAASVSTERASAVETVRDALDRITTAKALNAVVTVDTERALSDAATIDRRIRLGDNMPLAGVPVVVKDNIWVEGWRVTQGSRLFADFIAPRDAIAVERLQRAGAVVVGMGATSEFACKGVTTSLLFGPTRHPLNPELTPGGSSGGPATAVAADLVPLAIGTDAGGRMSASSASSRHTAPSHMAPGSPSRFSVYPSLRRSPATSRTPRSRSRRWRGSIRGILTRPGLKAITSMRRICA